MTVNNQTTTVASASEQAATARNGLEGHHPTLGSETGPDGPEKGIDGDGAFVGLSENLYDHLNCPACGGSGHVDDVKPASPVPHDRLSLVFPDASCATIARGVQAVAEALTLPHAVVALAEELVRAEDDCRVLSEAVAVEVTRRDKAERQLAELREEHHVALDELETARTQRDTATARLADMTTNRDALDQACQRKDERIDQLVAGARTSTAQITDLMGEVADLAIQRDAAAENARRERDRRGTYSDDTLKDCEDHLLDTLRLVGTNALLRPHGNDGPQARGVIVEAILRKAGLVSRSEQKPVVRVVTSPRFYGTQETWHGIAALRGEVARQCGAIPVDDDVAMIRAVEAVASALGMRRA